MKTIAIALLALSLPATARAIDCSITVDGQPAVGANGPLGPIHIGPMAPARPFFTQSVTDSNGKERRPAVTFGYGDEGDVLTVTILDFSQTKSVGSYDAAKMLATGTAGLAQGKGRLSVQTGDVPGDPVVKVDCR